MAGNARPGAENVGEDVMAKSELYEKGMAMRTELLGADYVEKMNKSTYDDPVMHKFRDVAAENVFGALWTRPGLDIKTRTLICVISDAATGRDPELALHIRMARRQGWTEEELTEALLHLSGYIGVPLIREAMLTASHVFKELREEGLK
jgi:4-carboxymuconolactone decarboxylase